MSKLKELRKSKNLTQADLAKILGLAVESVSRWERGIHAPRLYLPQLKTLCRVLDCNPGDIQDDTN